jgi:hypothetical protein
MPKLRRLLLAYKGLRSRSYKVEAIKFGSLEKNLMVGLILDKTTISMKFNI